MDNLFLKGKERAMYLRREICLWRGKTEEGMKRNGQVEKGSQDENIFVNVLLIIDGRD